MPELAEVEFFRKRWSAGHGARVLAVRLHEGKKIFRGCDTAELKRRLTGATLLGSETAAKQMLFRFSGDNQVGVHLGMSGETRVEARDYVATKHDHFILVQKERQLVLNDPRMFGQVRFHHGKAAPAWWTRIAPAILSPEFTLEAVTSFLRRRGRAPIKAVLLMQERFPGIGNWMADEILWRAAIHPRRPARSLKPAEVRALHRECRKLCRQALDTIAGRGNYLPPDLNVHIPKSWLFHHRWRPGGKCPRTGKPLAHATIGGRTTCWSPARQRME
ncbi:MAG TPA: DNA-formamidopyrimidine glycosylase family protein [Lacunisphaera sp.]|nr:DNA-formamidopyrimidine glycosylase family protein [Lacunisphaera sp.]